MEVGIWIKDQNGGEFLIKNDSSGYPDLLQVTTHRSLKTSFNAKARAKNLYQQITGQNYDNVFKKDDNTHTVIRKLKEEILKKFF